MAENSLITRNALNISNLDLPIYRTYSKERFLQLLETGNDALVWPRKWDDPFENLFLRSTGVTATGEFVTLEIIERLWYGQCWTYNEDTDALWRIYSPKKEGIKVRTTIRRLFENLLKSAGRMANLKVFIGQVAYMTTDEIVDLLNERSFADVAFGGQNHGFANLLCIKRDAFLHENEVRLLFCDVHQSDSASGVLQYPLDVNRIFDEIVIDPRLGDEEAEALQREIVAGGAMAPIKRSELYKAPTIKIRV